MRCKVKFVAGVMMALCGCAAVESGAGGADEPQAESTARAAPESASGAEEADAPNFGIAVLTLSRGRGVPAHTREAYAQIRALVEEEMRSGMAITASEQIIGLEGERRYCILLPDSAAREKLYRRLQALAANVELLRITVDGCKTNSF